jgi:hypothetical protein
MSSTSKGPRARAEAAGELATNWAIVRVVAGLVVVAGTFVVFWSAPVGDRNPLPQTVEGESLRRPVKSRELRREVFVFGRPRVQLAAEPELPPLRRPGPELPPERAPNVPEEVVLLASEIAGPASSDEFVAKAQPPAALVTLDERALLRQLGFGRSLDAELDELSASGQVPLPATEARRDPHIVDVDLNTEKGTVEKFLKMVEEVAPPERVRRTRGIQPTTETADASKKKELPAWAKGPDAWLDLVAKRSDLQGLPYRKGAACKLDGDSATILGAISQGLGATFALGARRVGQSYPVGPELLTAAVGMVESHDWEESLRASGDAAARNRSRHVDPDVVVPALMQMTQPRSVVERRSLIDSLATAKGRNATAALAQRALFELSKDLREKAVAALKQRPVAETRPHLLAGLRYPWAAVADHAAEALVALDDRDAAGDLVRLLGQGDPTDPFVNDSGKWAVRELVRVNHLQNCFLCHAPSLSSTDPVRGLVPVPGQVIPQQYYQESLGVFVRADVTYLKQDFSVMHPVKDRGKWPHVQRFDYLVRTRELTAAEVTKRQLPSPASAGHANAPEERSYPQREAVLYALRKLTNYDGSRYAPRWEEALRAAHPGKAK